MYKIIYPQYIFRGMVCEKNIAVEENTWTEGAMCLCKDSILRIIDRKDETGHRLYSIDMNTLGAGAGYKDGSGRDIFEGDIIRVKRFEPTPEELEMPEFNEENTDEEIAAFRRTVYDDIPDGAELISETQGIVFLSGNCFFMQYRDAQAGVLTAEPFYSIFGYDMLSHPGTAVKIIGNIYENEDIYTGIIYGEPNTENNETETVFDVQNSPTSN